MLERGQDRLAGWLYRSHHLNDDVDILARDELFDIVGEQADRNAAVSGDAAHPDTAQHQRGTNAGREVLSTVLDDADYLAADVAQPEHCYADRLFVTGHGSPHFQTQQIVDRLPAQDQAGTSSAHRHHGGPADHVVTARQ